MRSIPGDFRTLVDLCCYRGGAHGSQPAFVFLSGAGQNELSFAELDLRARAIASALLEQVAAGERVVLSCPPGLEYLTLFIGCLYAGVVAVPLYPPRLRQRTDRVTRVLADCEAKLIVTTQGLLAPLGDYLAGEADGKLISAEQLARSAPMQTLPQREPDSLAFIQYTSGSTGSPKGVMVTHRNIMANLRALQEAIECSSADIFVNWLPLFHDLGLIGTVLLPLYSGASSVLMNPAGFMQNPISWLEAITRWRGTVCGGPNFAYELCVERIRPVQLQDLDLSSWRVAFNAAEPVQAVTLENFARKFAAAGFARCAFYPTYGMAEATVFLAGGKPRQGPVIRCFDKQSLGQRQAVVADQAGQSLVGCGRAAAGHELCIVDPHTLLPLSEGAIGEIWASGPSIAEGYWGQPQLTRSTFRAELAGELRTFLRTGDLGFMLDGELYITGRLKDLIIIRGQNYFPQDIERTASRSHEALEPGAAAAFGLDEGEGERLVLVQEIKASHLKSAPAEEVRAAIRRAIAIEFDLKVEVVLIRPRTLAKTSSGKVQRSLTRQQYLQQQLAVAYPEPAMSPQQSAPQALTALQSELIALYEEVLKVSGVSLASDFFSLSGDSLEATRLVGRIEAVFGVAVPLDTFYNLATVEQVAEYLTACVAQLRGEGSWRRILPHPESRAPLSFAQRRLWLLSQLEGQNRVFNLPAVLSLRGELSVARLCEAFTRILERHEILRTTYVWEDSAAWQQVNPPRNVSIEVCDLRQEPQPLVRAQELAQQDAQLQFDLRNGPIFRVRLLRLEQDHHHLLFTIHHIAADAWSMQVMIEELQAFYGDPQRVMVAPEVRYADYAAWQARPDPAGLKRLTDYWRGELSDAPALLPLPYDRPRPQRQSFAGALHGAHLPQELIKQLKELGRRHKTTLFVTLLSAFQIQLQRLSAMDDIIVGTDVANRNHPQLSRIIGFFVNQLVLRADLRTPVTFEQLLCANRDRVARATAHQDMPFDRLVEELACERDPRYSPLFQVKFLLNHSPLSDVRLPGLTITPVPQAVRYAQYDLTLSIEQDHGGYSANFHYNTDLFDAASVGEFLADYLLMLKAIAQRSDIALRDIPCYQTQSAAYRGWMHGPQRHYAGCLQRCFEAQAARRPLASALVCGEEVLSYQRLNAEANKLAHLLKEVGIGANSLVGVHLGRSINQVVTLLALIKLGATFLPLDQDYPTERIEYMLNDSSPDLLITDDAQHAHLQEYPGALIVLDEGRMSIASEPDGNLEADSAPDDRAYLLYTSGSSGRPKGVLISVASLWNLCCWYQRFAEVDEHSHVLHAIPLSFDAAIKNILTPLLAGGTLVLPPGTRFDPAVFNQTIDRHQVTVINCVPSLFYSMLEHARREDYHALRSLCVVALGGEPTDVSALRSWLQSRNCQASIANIYGPTECTDISVACRVQAAQLLAESLLPIGRPIDNAKAYVVTPQMTLAPPGVAGELLIGGAGVGIGYFGQAGTDTDKFVADPFGGDGRLYRSGDLVKWDRHGRLHYLGRLDRQIKVNGVRIEAGEIEAALSEIQGIRQALVMLVGKRLTAYVLTSGLTPPTVSQLREQLRRRLPATWLPKSFVLLQQMPLLPNGKVDHGALASLALGQEREQRDIVPATTEMQHRLLEIFSQVLQQPGIGITDNFFELGGDSMAAVRVAALADEAQIPLSVAEIFELQTVAQLAEKCQACGLQQAEQTAQRSESQAFDMLCAEDLAALMDAR